LRGELLAQAQKKFLVMPALQAVWCRATEYKDLRLSA
jgi:hypothetical protein